MTGCVGQDDLDFTIYSQLSVDFSSHVPGVDASQIGQWASSPYFSMFQYLSLFCINLEL